MYDVALFILFVAGVHTALPLYWWTEFPVPYIACGVAMILTVPRIVPPRWVIRRFRRSRARAKNAAALPKPV